MLCRGRGLEKRECYIFRATLVEIEKLQLKMLCQLSGKLCANSEVSIYIS